MNGSSVAPHRCLLFWSQASVLTMSSPPLSSAQPLQAKRERSDAVARGRGEKRAQDFLEREFGNEASEKDADVANTGEVRVFRQLS